MAALPRTPSPLAPGLGTLALVPFVAGAAFVWLVDASGRAIVAQTLSAYAAVVVAFIGAIHWGFAFTSPEPAPRLFVWGVVPALVAWVAVLMSPWTGLWIHAVTLVVCYLVDRATYPRVGAAMWLPLRLKLTVVAALCCVAGAAAH